MKLSLQWLKDYIDFNLSAEELAHRLTMAGLEVEKISSVNQDTVFELEITPNRPDCLNMLGIAREVSAVLDKACHFPKIQDMPPLLRQCDIKIKDKSACQRYVGTLITDVNIASASEYITSRLASMGSRAINNIVDITNFVLFEMGQPLHAFDYDKLAGAKIIVRRARKGEKIVTLDGEERELDEEILVIADEKRPVAIAGIMGGVGTEVGPDTKNILLESAYFDPILIRRACRRLGLSSDSSYRFERGIDYFAVRRGASRAVELILRHAGGTVTGLSDISTKKTQYTGRKVKVSLAQINDRLGVKLTASRFKKIFKRLGFSVHDASGRICVEPPSFRADIKEAVDIIEETARIIGYDNLPMELPLIKGENIAPAKSRIPREILRQSLLASGANEAITYAMISSSHLEKSGLTHLKGVCIQNPLTVEQEMMRPSMLPSFLSIAKLNINRGEKHLRFFEIGKIYLPDGEKETVALLVCGLRLNDWRDTIKAELNFYDIKGMIEAAAERLRIDGLKFVRADFQCMEPGISAGLMLKGKEIGYAGKINHAVLDKWSIRAKNIFYAEINAEALYSSYQPRRKFIAPVGFPSIVRDISLAVKADICFQDITDIATSLGKGLLSSIRFNEEYLGDKIPKGYRGMSFSLIYQSPDRTLTEEEVEAVHEHIRQTLQKKMGAVMR